MTSNWVWQPIACQWYVVVWLVEPVMANLISKRLIFWNLVGSLTACVSQITSKLISPPSDQTLKLVSRRCDSVRACGQIRRSPRDWQLHQYGREGTSKISCTAADSKLIAWTQRGSTDVWCRCYLIPKMIMSEPVGFWPRLYQYVHVTAYSRGDVSCVNTEIRFLPKAETNQHFLIPQPLTLIAGDGYTPAENWISMLYYYMKTVGVTNRVYCLLIELAVNQMNGRAIHSGSLLKSTCHQHYRKCPSLLLYGLTSSTKYLHIDVFLKYSAEISYCQCQNTQKKLGWGMTHTLTTQCVKCKCIYNPHVEVMQM